MSEILALMRSFDLKGLLLQPTQNGLLQFFRYCFVGGIATVADWAVLYFLTNSLGIYHLISSVVSFVAGLLTNFLLSKLLVFSGSEAKGNVWTEFAGYAVIGVIGLGITELILFVFTDLFKLYFMLSKAIATVFVLLWNYLARKILLYN